MTKTLLLTAAAVTALVAAGSAQAGSLSARAGTGAVTATAASPYKLAQELNFGAGVSAPVGTFDTVFTFNNALAPGSYTVTLAYSGATITAAVPTTTVSNTATQAAGTNTTDALGFEATVVGAGSGPNTLTVTGQTSTQVTFALQIPAGNTVGGIYLSPALLVTGPVSVTAAVTNQVTGAVVDPAVIQPLITTGSRSVAARIDRALTATAGTAYANDAGTDTRISEGAAPVFTTLTGGPQVGQVEVAVAGADNFNAVAGIAAGTANTPVYKDLTGTPVALTDISSVGITVGGTLTGYRFRTNTEGTGPANPTTASATSVTLPGVTGATLAAADTANAGTAGGATITVEASALATNPTELAPTDLPVSVQLTLGAGFATPAAITGSFETIQSDGFAYLIPWVASQTLSGQSGNQTVIRVSNIQSDASYLGGRVYAQMYNNTGTSTNAGRSALLGTIGASGELVITSTSLEQVFGNFGRADFRLIVTDIAADGNNVPGATTVPFAATAASTTQTGANSIVVKRLIATANGGLTEVAVLPGAVGSEANIPQNQAAPY